MRETFVNVIKHLLSHFQLLQMIQKMDGVKFIMLTMVVLTPETNVFEAWEDQRVIKKQSAVDHIQIGLPIAHIYRDLT